MLHFIIVIIVTARAASAVTTTSATDAAGAAIRVWFTGIEQDFDILCLFVCLSFAEYPCCFVRIHSVYE